MSFVANERMATPGWKMEATDIRSMAASSQYSELCDQLPDELHSLVLLGTFASVGKHNASFCLDFACKLHVPSPPFYSHDYFHSFSQCRAAADVNSKTNLTLGGKPRTTTSSHSHSNDALRFWFTHRSRVCDGSANRVCTASDFSYRRERTLIPNIEHRGVRVGPKTTTC